MIIVRTSVKVTDRTVDERYRMDLDFLYTWIALRERGGNYLEWMGPGHLPSFEVWWQSDAAKAYVDDRTCGVIELETIDWTLIRELQKKDVLKFVATFKLTLPEEHHNTSVLIQIVRSFE